MFVIAKYSLCSVNTCMSSNRYYQDVILIKYFYDHVVVCIENQREREEEKDSKEKKENRAPFEVFSFHFHWSKWEFTGTWKHLAPAEAYVHEQNIYTPIDGTKKRERKRSICIVHCTTDALVRNLMSITSSRTNCFDIQHYQCVSYKLNM